MADWAIWPIWKPVHLQYCLALDDITLTLWLAGERQISKMTGERAVDGLKKRLGPDDPLTLNTMFNLARTYFHLCEEAKAHQLLVWVLRLQKRFFGMRHPDTLMTRNELGMLLCAGRRHLFAAHRLVDNVLQARKQILGDEHAYTLWSVNDLSKIHVEMGRPDEAVKILEEIIPVVIRTLGDDNVGMTMTISNLAKAYCASGRWKDAEEIIRPLLASIPHNHPDWIHNMYACAYIKFNLGKTEEGERYCVEIIDEVTQKKSVSLSDPRIVTTAELLSSIYQLQHREDRLAAIRKSFLSLGFTKVEDQVDPYGVRGVFAQLPPPRRVTPSTEKLIPTTSSQREPQQPFPRPVVRRTFWLQGCYECWNIET